MSDARQDRPAAIAAGSFANGAFPGGRIYGYTGALTPFG